MSEQLNKFTMYAIRANDIYPTVSKAISPDLSTRLRKTVDIGALSNLIKIIKNVRAVIEKDKLIYLATNAGIDYHAVDYYLRELQDIEVINVSGNSIENNVPSTSLEIYDRLGDKLERLYPSEFELQHFELLNSVAELPARIVDLYHSVDIMSREMNIFKTIGSSCGYLDYYVSPTDGSEVLYSPVYWEENPEKLFELVDKFQYNTVFNKIKSLREKQGLPVSSVAADPILSEAVALGCLPTNSVTSAGGEHFFVFTPNSGVKKYDKDIIKKARQIVASVRYGQNFAQITKIRSIKHVLGSLLRRGRIGDHSENIHQYAMLIEMGLIFPVKAHFGHEIHLNDTEENRRIFDIAMEMIDHGTVTDRDSMVADNDIQSVFREGKTVGDELVVINKFKKEIPSSTDTLQRIGDYLRGVDEDVL